MYALTFMYPGGAIAFDLDHFLKVHLPLGLWLVKKHLGIKPVKLMVQAPTIARDVAVGSAQYGGMSSVIFETEDEVMKFSTLFEFEEAARLLSEDFPNYTAGPPTIMIAKFMELTDVDGLVAAYEKGAGPQAT